MAVTNINFGYLTDIVFNNRYPLDEVYFNNGVVNVLVWSRGKDLCLSYIPPLFNYLGPEVDEYYYGKYCNNYGRYVVNGDGSDPENIFIGYDLYDKRYLKINEIWNTQKYIDNKILSEDINDGVAFIDDYNYLSRYAKTRLLTEEIISEYNIDGAEYAHEITFGTFVDKVTDRNRFFYDYTAYNEQTVLNKDKYFGAGRFYTKPSYTSYMNVDFNFLWKKSNIVNVCLNANCNNLFTRAIFFPDTFHGVYENGKIFDKSNIYWFDGPLQSGYFTQGVFPTNYYEVVGAYNKSNGHYFYTYYSRPLYMPFSGRKDELKGINHFDFKYVEEMANIFNNQRTFKGNYDGYAPYGDNVINMQDAFRNTNILYPTCGSNVINMCNAYRSTTPFKYNCGVRVKDFNKAYFMTRMGYKYNNENYNLYAAQYLSWGDKSFYLGASNELNPHEHFYLNELNYLYIKNDYDEQFNLFVDAPMTRININQRNRLALVSDWAYKPSIISENNYLDTLVYEDNGENRLVLIDNKGSMFGTPQDEIYVHNNFQFIENYGHDIIREYGNTDAVLGGSVLYMDSSYRNSPVTNPIVTNIVKVTNNAYADCWNFDTPALENGARIEYMCGMYSNCSNLTTAICYPNVIDMSNAFELTNIDTQVPAIGPKVKYMQAAYAGSNIMKPECTDTVLDLGYAYCHLEHINRWYSEEDRSGYITITYNGNISIYNGFPTKNERYSRRYDWYDNDAIDRDTCVPIEYYTCGDNVFWFDYTYCKRPAPYGIEPVCGDNVFYMQGTYYRCYNITTAAVGPNVFDMYRTYAYCENLVTPAFGPNVYVMDDTYYSCDSIVEVPKYDFPTEGENKEIIIHNYYTGKDEKIKITRGLINTFRKCKNLEISSCGNNVYSMVYTYADCPKLKVSSCGDSTVIMNGTFNNCEVLPSATCGPSVMYMIDTYSYCPNLTLAACGGKVEIMNGTYAACTKLEEAVCGPNVINMDKTYSSCSNLTKAACGNRVKNMNYTYELCHSLTQAVSGPNVIDMNFTYHMCSNLLYSACGDKVESMNSTYRDCSSLLYATCGDSVKTMNNTYFNCNNLIQAACGASVKYMNYTYENCNSLKIAVCGPSVTDLKGTYKNCSSLTDAACSDSVVNMNNTYYNCFELVNAACGNNVISLIGTYQNLPKLKTAKVGKKVKTMDSAYRNCPVLETCEVGESVTSMAYAYADCYSLTEAKSGPNVMNMLGAYRNDCNLTKAACGDRVTVLFLAYKNCNNLTDAVCGKSVLYMSEAYADCTSLINTACGPHVTSMNYAYLNCTSAISPSAGSSVAYMRRTYENCTSLIGYNEYSHIYYNTEDNTISYNNEIYLSDSIIPYYTMDAENCYLDCENLVGMAGSSIRDGAVMNNVYRNCSNITSALMYKNVFYSNTFNGCTSLKRIGIEEVGERKSIPTVNLFNTLEYKLYYDLSMNNLSEVNSVRHCFYNCYNLEGDFVLKSDLSSYNIYEAFYECHNVNSVNFAGVLTKAANNLDNFCYNCYNLKQTLNTSQLANVTNMSKTYYGCNSLTSCSIGNNVLNLYYCYANCDNLESVTYLGSWSNRNNITNAMGMFSGCTKLSTQPLQLTNGTALDKIKKDARYMYENCKGLQGTQRILMTPNNYIMVDGLFKDCSNIIKIDGVCKYAGDTPISVDEIFMNCYKLEDANTCYVYGNNAYYDCRNLKWTAIDFIKYISLGNIFYNCYSLNALPAVYPSSMRAKSPYGYFYNCTNAKYIKSPIPTYNSGVYLHAYGYYNCTNLIGENNVYCTDDDFASYHFSSDSNISHSFYNCKNYSSDCKIFYDDGLDNNLSYAFYNCNNINSIYFETYSHKSVDNWNVDNMFLRLKDNDEDIPNRFNFVTTSLNAYEYFVSQGSKLGMGELSDLGISLEEVTFNFKDYTGACNYSTNVVVKRAMYNAANKFYIYCCE